MMAQLIELSEFDIRYEPRGSIKAQHLAYFLNELHPIDHFDNQWWTLHVDRSSNKQGCRARVLLEGPNQVILEQFLKFEFKASNNQAEYEAFLVGSRLAKEVNTKWLKCWSDSKVTSDQINREYQVKEPQLLKYYHAFMRLKYDFEEVQVKHIDRDHTTELTGQHSQQVTKTGTIKNFHTKDSARTKHRLRRVHEHILGRRRLEKQYSRKFDQRDSS